MKRLTAIFITAMMLLAVMPLAVFADEDAGREGVNVSAEAETSVGVRTALPEKSSETAKERHEKAGAMYEAAQEHRAEARDEAGEKREKMAEKREEMMEKREMLKAALEDDRKAVMSIRDNVRECKDKETDVCGRIRKEAKMHAAEYLEHATEKVIDVLNHAKERVEASDLNAEAKTEILGEIDAQIAKATTDSSTLASLNENSTKDEVQSAVKSLREVWQDTQKAVHKAMTRSTANKLGGIIERASHLEERLNTTVARLNATGKDTASIEAEIADFKASIEKAKALHTEAQALAESKEAGTTDETMKQATGKLREAQAALKKAHEALKNILHGIKALAGEKDLEASAEAHTGAEASAAA